jgi:hypothetical protein
LQKLADAGLVDWLRSEPGRSLGHPHQTGADSQAASGIPDTDVAPLVDAAVLLQRTMPADFSDDPAGPTKARARLDIEL